MGANTQPPYDPVAEPQQTQTQEHVPQTGDFGIGLPDIGYGAGVFGAVMGGVVLLNKIWTAIKNDRLEYNSSDKIASANSVLIDRMRDEIERLATRVITLETAVQQLQDEKVKLVIEMAETRRNLLDCQEDLVVYQSQVQQ